MIRTIDKKIEKQAIIKNGDMIETDREWIPVDKIVWEEIPATTQQVENMKSIVSIDERLNEIGEDWECLSKEEQKAVQLLWEQITQIKKEVENKNTSMLNDISIIKLIARNLSII